MATDTNGDLLKVEWVRNIQYGEIFLYLVRDEAQIWLFCAERRVGGKILFIAKSNSFIHFLIKNWNINIQHKNGSNLHFVSQVVQKHQLGELGNDTTALRLNISVIFYFKNY